MARSTMSAVFSLGGRGCRASQRCCLSFGAPNLAMTVETLTVLILRVSTFDTFPPTRPAVSSRLVRARERSSDCRRDRYLHWRTTLVATTEIQEAAGVLAEFRPEPGAWAKHRQRHPGRFWSVRHTRRNRGLLATAALGVRGLLRFAATRRQSHVPDAVAPRILHYSTLQEPQPAWWPLAAGWSPQQHVCTLRNRIRQLHRAQQVLIL